MLRQSTSADAVNRKFAASRAALLAALALLAACSGGDGGGGGTPTGPPGGGGGNQAVGVQAVGSTHFSGAPGYTLDDSMAVKVVDRVGNGVAGVTVQFAAGAGGGTVSPASATTDGSGVAKAAWTLAGSTGEQAASATVSGMTPVAFGATAAWGPEARVTVVSGDAQTMVPGCAVAAPLTVKVTDAGGAAVANASVYFDVAAGAGRLAAAWARTDAQGLASAGFAPGQAGASTVRASLHSQAPAAATFTASGARMVPGGFAVVGNKVVSAACAETRFVGLARPFLESWHRGDDRLIDPQMSRTDFRNIRAWHSNVVRIPINESFWLSTAANYDPEYRALVDSTVHRAEEAGLNVILDLHFSDQGDPNRSAYTLEPLPDVNHAIPFWREVATAYRNDPRVLFEMYNEPHDVSWAMWRDGGVVHDTSGTYQGAGYQQLYDAIRSVGADNIVIANGLNWGFDLSGVATHRLSGYNVMYGTHVYDWPEKQPAAWDAGFGNLAATAPVMIGEFGTMNCGVAYYNAVMSYADQKKLHMVAWAWYAPPADRQDLVCTFAALISDWNGTPTPVGAAVKAHYAAY
ncbi:MAG: Endoglucanase precursor [Gemmatimonadetes bacterium]|nr:Endoglucanase precursor [Gemmatimonadota bacterium]